MPLLAGVQPGYAALVRIGRIIADKYCLLYELGRGSMGSVWAAEHLTLRSRVAVKLIDPQVYGIPQALHRFEREARALAILRSPHVVQVLDYGVDSGNPYLVMELLEGVTLRRRLQTYGRLTWATAWTLTQHLARAMSVADAAGFVHRDLKPENVFLVSDGDEFVGKVLDFGIAKTLATAATPLTAVGSILGTWQYASPEQIAGQLVDARSDLWSLGVIVFECVTGFLPFNAESAVAAIFGNLPRADRGTLRSSACAGRVRRLVRARCPPRSHRALSDRGRASRGAATTAGERAVRGILVEPMALGRG